MNLKIGIGLLTSCICGVAWGEACDVTQRPGAAQVPVVQSHTCFEYKGMPAGAMDWACSNEDKGATPSEKHKIASCPSGAVASCTATLSPETLANERSTSREPGENTAQVPDGAEVITLYYEMREQAQARIDCEQAGGKFSSPLK